MDTLSTMAIFCFQGVERFDCIKITGIDLSLSLSLSMQRRHYALKWHAVASPVQNTKQCPQYSFALNLILYLRNQEMGKLTSLSSLL